MSKIFILSLFVIICFGRIVSLDAGIVLDWAKVSKVVNKNSQEESTLIGKITINSSNVHFRVVQAEDNFYFLSHDEDGNDSAKGSIFLDYRNDVWDEKLLIYGHNSEIWEDAPFHFLEYYLNNEYANTHRYLLFEGDHFSFWYELFTVMVVTSDYHHINLKFDDNTYYEHLLWLQQQSRIDIPLVLREHDSILLMQTCYYDPKPSYLVLGFRKR
ncbi:MAG: class B sortase [bacterium]|nr:class B sortase [bacterium]